MTKTKNMATPTNRPPAVSDLQKLILEFESVTTDLRNLTQSDAEERELLSEARDKFTSLQKEVESVLAGNERARRERQVKLYNLRELLRPIIWAGELTGIQAASTGNTASPADY